MIYVGYEKWTSKIGNVGYNLYFMEEVKNGSGARYVTYYKNGIKNIPKTDEDHFKSVFSNMNMNTKIDELYFNERGYIVGAKIGKN